MPNIQIRGSQIQGETIEASNINLSGSFDFRAATGLEFLTKPEADKTTFPATTQFVHTIVSGSLIDGFSSVCVSDVFSLSRFSSFFFEDDTIF